MNLSKAKPTVLLVESSVREIDQEQWKQALNHFDFINYDCKTTEEFCERLSSGGKYSEINAILKVGWLKAGPFAQHYIFGSGFIEHYPPSLKLICCTGHGHDAADVKALTQKGILYANTPDTCTESVANTALYLILDTFRHFCLADHHVRTNNWLASRELGIRAIDPEGQSLGIIGLGDIGTRIAKKAAGGLSMKVSGAPACIACSANTVRFTTTIGGKGKMQKRSYRMVQSIIQTSSLCSKSLTAYVSLVR